MGQYGFCLCLRVSGAGESLFSPFSFLHVRQVWIFSWVRPATPQVQPILNSIFLPTLNQNCFSLTTKHTGIRRKSLSTRLWWLNYNRCLQSVSSIFKVLSLLCHVLFTFGMPVFAGSSRCLWEWRILNNSIWWRNENTQNIHGFQSCRSTMLLILECFSKMIYGRFFLSCTPECSRKFKAMFSRVLLTSQLLSFTNKRENALQDPLPQGFFVRNYSKDPLALGFGHTSCVFSFTNVYGPSGTFVESLTHHFR